QKGENPLHRLSEVQCDGGAAGPLQQAQNPGGLADLAGRNGVFAARSCRISAHSWCLFGGLSQARRLSLHGRNVGLLWRIRGLYAGLRLSTFGGSRGGLGSGGYLCGFGGIHCIFSSAVVTASAYPSLGCGHKASRFYELGNGKTNMRLLWSE